MKRKKYDFAGWVTKNDILCSDGVVIKHNAFIKTQPKVPLVWNHDHSDPTNIIGYVELEHRDKGVYGYGYFNDTENANAAKLSVQHGDISSMSIGANKIKKRSNEVIHGIIREVSLVLAGANPGAMIESVMSHSDDEAEEAIIYTGTLIHSSDDIIEEEEELDNEELEHEDLENDESDPSVGEVLETLSADQLAAVEILLENIILDKTEGDDNMKHNTFEGPAGDTLNHSEVFGELMQSAMQGETTLQHTLKESAHEYGIKNIELLFPEATVVGAKPGIYKDQNTNTQKILGKIHKSPFSRIKTITADLTEKECRARGYIKGNEKIEQIFSLMTRTTTPQTIYKKQKLDRDDIIDVTDVDIVAFLQMELRMMLEEEIVRAVLVGDGREITDKDKIKEDHIRPVMKDDVFYTIKLEVKSPAEVLESVIYALADYQGSGTPDLYLHPTMAAALKLVKKADGSYLFGDIPSLQSIAARLGVNEIIATSFLAKNQMCIVNLSDYTLGSTKGGETTTFSDFDIDFNQYKYLIETRLSGALTVPKSAIAITVKSVDIKTPAITIDEASVKPVVDALKAAK